ncbi:hypothetical protein DFQ29_000876, partial [Apophysomyces sp. BC1021]
MPDPDIDENFYKTLPIDHPIDNHVGDQIDHVMASVSHSQKRARVGKALHQRGRETWRRFCTQLETDDYSKTTATIKRIRQRRTIQPTLSHPDGPTAATEAMARQLETVYDGHLLSTRPQHDNTSTTTSSVPSEFPITEAAVTSALERLPPKKAPGIDH